ncbi:MAG: PD-(D/E)XK nuclease family protein [Verrucomicrobiales bacterium]|nr:PD-(D/E)XK nuclease family protein [Verrucomicrobiales bacterium]
MTPDELISKFGRLRALKTPRTFLELAGYPHYENVSSNLLAFYLDPVGEHGLGDLLLRAFMNCVGIPWEATIHQAQTDREVYTKHGGKLDLLIVTDDFIIGVENKIWAPLHNDLDDYGRLITETGTKIGLKLENCHRVVLTVRDLSPDERRKAERSDFRVLRFAELSGAVRSLLGHYTRRADFKHLSYFTDLMQTLENLTGASKSELNQFLATHAREIEELNRAYWEYRKQLIPEVRRCLAETPLNQFNEEEIRYSIYQGTTLVTHVRCRDAHQKQAISVDLETSSECWKIVLFSRGFSDYKFTDASTLAWAELSPELLERLGASFQPEENGNLKAEFPPELKPAEISQRLSDVVLKVREALGYGAPSPMS